MMFRTVILIVFIVAIIGLRLVLQDLANFAPIAAAGIFAAFYFKKYWVAVAVPLTALLFTDTIVHSETGMGLYSGRLVDYFAIALVIAFAYFAFKRNRKLWNIGLTVLIGSLIFFFVSNLGVFLLGNMYAKTPAGLVDCFVKAIPFYRGTLIGDLFFTGVFFGLFELAQAYIPALAEEKA